MEARIRWHGSILDKKMNLDKEIGAAQFSAIEREEEHMYRRIGLLTVVLAAFVMLNAGLAKAQGAPPSAAPGTADDAALLGGKALPSSTSPAVANPQTAVACQICFTCGGDWPIFAGAPRFGAASGTQGAFERGPGCSGSLTSTGDTDPFLCCR